jgi:hypothetical protein
MISHPAKVPLIFSQVPRLVGRCLAVGRDSRAQEETVFCPARRRSRPCFRSCPRRDGRGRRSPRDFGPCSSRRHGWRGARRPAWPDCYSSASAGDQHEVVDRAFDDAVIHVRVSGRIRLFAAGFLNFHGFQVSWNRTKCVCATISEALPPNTRKRCPRPGAPGAATPCCIFGE